MIRIQLKDGKQYKTETVTFITLSNVPCIDFWNTTSAGNRVRDEIPLSKIDTITSCTEESIEKLNKSVAEILYTIGVDIGFIKVRLGIEDKIPGMIPT